MNENMPLSPPPLSLYLHVPFCLKKCPYCDFHSAAVGREVPYLPYSQALLQELTMWRNWLSADNRPLLSIFFGGGTPSLLPHGIIKTILDEIRSLWPLETNCEITLEANPESCSVTQLAGWKNAGVTRLSLGVQSFREDRLAWLARPHDVAAARLAIHHARQIGFDSMSLDLIYATPGQTLAQWRDELHEAMSWNPEHFSCYSLTVEEGTPLSTQFKAGHWQPLDEQTEYEFFQQTRTLLADHGWHPYEISNFARDGHLCTHNLNYWQSGDYLGLGPAAHGRLTRQDGQISRTINQYRFRPYAEHLERGVFPWQQQDIVSAKESAADCMIVGLRLQQGMQRKTYQHLAGVDIVASYPNAIQDLVDAGLLLVEPESIRLTAQGFCIADAIMERLL